MVSQWALLDSSFGYAVVLLQLPQLMVCAARALSHGCTATVVTGHVVVGAQPTAGRKQRHGGCGCGKIKQKKPVRYCEVSLADNSPTTHCSGPNGA